MEFRLEDDGKKACYKCNHYGCLINQGYRWCNLQLDMDAEDCEAYDTSLYDTVITTYSSSTYDKKPKVPSTTPKQYGINLLKHKIKNKKIKK